MRARGEQRGRAVRIGAVNVDTSDQSLAIPVYYGDGSSEQLVPTG